MPFVSRTRATLRSAEFGFLGVAVYTRVQTPRFCGAPRRAGVFVFAFGAWRPFRTSWFTVGTLVEVLSGRAITALHATKSPAVGRPRPNQRRMVATTAGPPQEFVRRS